ncbi:MAG: hypothetical protein ACD_20C00391G0017 [uncultured bacterium]|nr:MAG: hypothetical protein ACD_20C00391G0017 [uncultured bacterium]HBH17337.1 transcriptional regulator [Cyanobacteria bacterium UBA9579]
MNKEFLIKFGNKIKEFRIQKGLTQEELAFEAGVSRSTIAMVEVAQRDIILSKIVDIANALGVKPYQLIEFD